MTTKQNREENVQGEEKWGKHTDNLYFVNKMDNISTTDGQVNVNKPVFN